MRWKYLALILFALCLLTQHVRILNAERQLSILEDCCQRQEVCLNELKEKLASQEEPAQPDPLETIIRKYTGYFDDHDVSGLLEDDG